MKCLKSMLEKRESLSLSSSRLSLLASEMLDTIAWSVWVALVFFFVSIYIAIRMMNREDPVRKVHVILYRVRSSWRLMMKAMHKHPTRIPFNINLLSIDMFRFRQRLGEGPMSYYSCRNPQFLRHWEPLREQCWPIESSQLMSWTCPEGRFHTLCRRFGRQWLRIRHT